MPRSGYFALFCVLRMTFASLREFFKFVWRSSSISIKLGPSLLDRNVWISSSRWTIRLLRVWESCSLRFTEILKRWLTPSNRLVCPLLECEPWWSVALLGRTRLLWTFLFGCFLLTLYVSKITLSAVSKSSSEWSSEGLSDMMSSCSSSWRTDADTLEGPAHVLWFVWPWLPRLLRCKRRLRRLLFLRSTPALLLSSRSPLFTPQSFFASCTFAECK